MNKQMGNLSRLNHPIKKDENEQTNKNWVNEQLDKCRPKLSHISDILSYALSDCENTQSKQKMLEQWRNCSH